MIDAPDIFISYADADAEWTGTWLVPKLHAQGLRVTSANDLLAGGARIEQIAQEAERSKHTLLVLSPDWVKNQWETFTGLISHSADPVGRQRRTIPLLRRACEPPRSIARLVSADFASDNPSDWEKQLSRLLAVLSGQQSRTALGPPLGALMGAEAPTNFRFRQNPHFVGRDQELAEIHELLDDATPLGVNAARTSPRAAGLTGLGGVGKTQLVVEYIHRYGKSYPGGIFWINAADGVVDDFVEIGRVISGNGHEKTPDELIRISYDYLRSDPDILLVVDNLNEPSLLNQEVAGILTPISLPCRLLFTTRRRDLRGLRSIAVDMLTEPDALKLLLRSRPAIMDNNHPEHPMAIKLCATLGGLPLAIEMAAAFLEQAEEVPLSGYLKRLGREGSLQTLDTLEQAKDWSPTWHDPIQITLKSQWEALTNAEARLLLQAAALMPEAAAIPLARLGLLTGLSTIAEEGYSSPLASALRRLHNYSLIEMLEGDQVRLHPLVREFVRISIANLDEFSLQCSTNMADALKDMLRVNKEISERGVDGLLADIKFGLSLATGNKSLEELLLVLDKEAHNLRRPFCHMFPAYSLQQIRKRVYSLHKLVLLERVEKALHFLRAPWFRERIPSQKESLALIRTLEGHSGPVHAVAITPDGKHALSASRDNTLRQWDLESGQTLRTFEGPEAWSRFTGVAITPDGKHALSASMDGTLRQWDLETGQTLRTYRGYISSLTGVAITPDGKRALSASIDRTLSLWDLENGQILRTFKAFKGKTKSVEGVAITPDGKRALSASEDKTLRLWDLESGQTLRTFKGHTGAVTGVAITPDGKSAFSASIDGTLRLWDLESGQTLRTFKRNISSVTGVAITPDGKHALSASMDGTLRLWDLESGQTLRTFEGHTASVTSVAITPDGKRALSASEDNTLRLWDLESDQTLRTFEGHSGSVRAVAITPDGKRALSASMDRTLRLWDLENGQILRTLEGHTSSVNSVAITPEGKRAFSASWDKTLRLWDLESGQTLRTFKRYISSVTGVAITPDGRRALSASRDHTLRLWDLESGQTLRTFKGHTGAVTGVAITPDGKRAISGSLDMTLRLWDLESGQTLRTFKRNISSVTGVAITPDGKRAFSASWETLDLWDLESGQTLRTFKGHTASVTGVAITPDGKRALSASEDKTLRLWDLESGQASVVFAGEEFTAVALSKDEHLIVVGSKNGAVNFLDVVDGIRKN